MNEIPMKSNKGKFTIFYLSMDTSIVPIGALVFVLHALEVRSYRLYKIMASEISAEIRGYIKT